MADKARTRDEVYFEEIFGEMMNEGKNVEVETENLLENSPKDFVPAVKSVNGCDSPEYFKIKFRETDL